MTTLPNVVVILARCTRTRQSLEYATRNKLVINGVMNWAFTLKETVVNRERYEQSEINGSFQTAENFPDVGAQQVEPDS